MHKRFRVVNSRPSFIVRLTVVVGTLASLGIYAINQSSASTYVATKETESGIVTQPATIVADVAASGGQAIRFIQPGGNIMPVGDKPGWRQVLADDFNGSMLGTGWGKYSGNIPSMPGGVWDPARVQVSNGSLKLQAADRGDGTWTSGGAANTGAAKRTYGKWEMRMRMTKGNGVKYAALLWPSNGTWPVDGEIDFAEDGGGDRSGTAATTHYAGPDGTGHYIVQRSLKIDMSQWQNIGVEWKPGRLVYTINGQPWGEVTTPPAAIPDGPMFFAIQTEANTRGATQWMTTVDSTTPPLVTCEVDWLVVYAPSS